MIARHSKNAPGDWYVDTRCTDCGAARDVAPGLIVEQDGQSVFARQPKTKEELLMAWRARLLCPTASVRSESHSDAPEGAFPQKLAPNVYRLGYNAASSYGAHSYFIARAGGNAMVDGPRWTNALVAAMEKKGGLALVLLTHQDDIGDAERYAEHFGARVFIHEADKRRAPFATGILRGREPTALADDLLAIPVPGHTKGSVVYLYDKRCLFTGDSLAWDAEAGDLAAWKDYCWYSWEEQASSLARLLDQDFSFVLAGHGGSKELPAGEMRTRLAALVERMKSTS
jgi:glyoxylase-like metal-dependent hydrolase (beta-lactamase superfamily II)